ncbi:MAG: hypothetical protein U1F58_11240 [Burkholderiales bacterium]
MEDQTTTRNPGFDLRTREGRAYVAYGAWLRVAITGAGATLGGIALMLSGDAAPASGLALAFGGAAVAYASWRRAVAVLEAIGAPPAVSAPAPERGQRAPLARPMTS